MTKEERRLWTLDYQRRPEIKVRRRGHRLSQIDKKHCVAVCEICGPVPLRHFKYNGGYRCWLCYGNIKVAYLGQALDMWNEQRGKCSICGDEMLVGIGDGRQANSVVADHNHLTGYLRGFLHQNCNRIIGYADDSPDLCKKAAEYLIRTRS